MDPTVLFCGRLEWQKGPDLLVEAVPLLLGYYPNAKFVFVGEGNMRGCLEQRGRQLGVAHALRFLGYRHGNGLVDLYGLSDTVCVPSRNEPFGIVVLEAWAARKPVVVSQVGGPNEYVCHEVNGLKIYPRTDSVAWGLGTLLADFERARWMGENGRRAVQDSFTWDAIAPQTVAVYDPAYASRPSAAPAPMMPVPAVAAEITPAREVPPPEPTAEQLQPVGVCTDLDEAAPEPEFAARRLAVRRQIRRQNRLLMRPPHDEDRRGPNEIVPEYAHATLEGAVPST
jgi:hypothetical protein